MGNGGEPISNGVVECCNFVGVGCGATVGVQPTSATTMQRARRHLWGDTNGAENGRATFGFADILSFMTCSLRLCSSGDRHHGSPDTRTGQLPSPLGYTHLNRGVGGLACRPWPRTGCAGPTDSKATAFRALVEVSRWVYPPGRSHSRPHKTLGSCPPRA